MDIVKLAIKVATDELDRARSGLTSLEKDLKSAESAGYKFGFAIGESVKIAATSFASLGAAVGSISLVMAGQIDDLQDLADMYGYSATQIAAMKRAAEDAGGTLEDVVKASNKARKELADGGEAFKALGISVTDANGQLKTGTELATEVAIKYREGGTSAAQFGDVVKVLGRDVDKAAAVLASQADAVSLVNELQEQGIGIVQGSITATNDFSAAKARASLVMQSAGSVLVANVIPAFTVLIKSLTDSYVSGGFVKQAFEGLLGLLPGMIEFGGFIAKVFVTAANTVRAFGDSLGAIGAVVSSLLDGNFTGAFEIAKAWKGNVDAIDEQNKRALAGIDSTVKGMQAAVKNVDLTLPELGKGRASTGDTPTGKPTSSAKERAPRESGIESELLNQQKSLIKLAEAYGVLYGAEAQTNQQLVEATIASGKYAAQVDATGKLIKKAATEEEIAMLRSNAVLEDAAIIRNKLAAAQIKAVEAIAHATASSRDEVAVNRLRIKVMSDVGATQDDLNVAIADYNVQMAEKALKDAEDANASKEKLITLRAEIELLKQKKKAAEGIKADNDMERGPKDGIEDFTNGWDKAFKTYQKNAMTAADIGTKAFESMSSNMESAIEKFAMTGKLSFSDFARSVLADMAKIAAKQAASGLMGMLGKAIGGFFGGGAAPMEAIGTGSSWAFANGAAFDGGVKFFANGDVFNSPTAFGMQGGLGVMGEAGPEAIMPLKRNSNGQLGVVAQGAGGGGTTQINNITVNVQGGQTNAETGATVSQEIVKVMKGVAQQEIARSAREKRMAV